MYVNVVHNCRHSKLSAEQLKGSRRLHQGRLTNDGKTRIQKSFPNPNVAYDESQVETLQTQKEMICGAEKEHWSGGVENL